MYYWRTSLKISQYCCVLQSSDVTIIQQFTVFICYSQSLFINLPATERCWADSYSSAIVCYLTIFVHGKIFLLLYTDELNCQVTAHVSALFRWQLFCEESLVTLKQLESLWT